MATSTSTDPTEPDGCSAAPIHHGLPIDTAHLRLRRPVAGDGGALSGMAAASSCPPHLARTLATFGESPQRFDYQQILIIDERVGGGTVGTCAATGLDHGEAEFSLWLAPAVGGRGYDGEVLQRCLRMLFVDFGVGSVSLTVPRDDPTGRHLLAGNGFVANPGISADGAEPWRLERPSWQRAHAARPIVMVAAAALIDADGRVLLASRPPGKTMGGQWEFPGGKLDPGETPEAALVRELREELGLDVRASCLAPLAFASHDYDRFHLLMPLYACRRWDGIAFPREGQKLAWVGPARLTDYPMPPADLPLVAALRDWL